MTTQEYLWESAMRGFFLLKAAFLRLDSSDYREEHAPDSLDNSHPFHQAMAIYVNLCKTAVPSRVPHQNQLARFARRALCSVAGLVASDANEELNRQPGTDALLLGGLFAIERALHILSILTNDGKGVEIYGTCCAVFRQKWASRSRLWTPNQTVVEALEVVTGATGRDPCDPVNWAAPDEADWGYVVQISRAMWDLLGHESDPFNSLHCVPGGTSP